MTPPTALRHPHPPCRSSCHLHLPTLCRPCRGSCLHFCWPFRQPKEEEEEEEDLRATIFNPIKTRYLSCQLARLQRRCPGLLLPLHSRHAFRPYANGSAAHLPFLICTMVCAIRSRRQSACLIMPRGWAAQEGGRRIRKAAKMRFTSQQTPFPPPLCTTSPSLAARSVCQ